MVLLNVEILTVVEPVAVFSANNSVAGKFTDMLNADADTRRAGFDA